MLRHVMTSLMIILSFGTFGLKAYDIVVADSATHIPLPNASIYDNNGNAIAMSNHKGILPKIAPKRYPITIRYIGFNEKKILSQPRDTIFLSEGFSELPEVVVASQSHRVLHILAYVREYSTLSSYTDTVFLFREKMVDYMLPSHPKVKFNGWSTPRILACKSYYRFTDANGLDSVSDTNNHHFSWADWIGIPPGATLPLKLWNRKTGTDTIYGKYTPAEIWTREKDDVSVRINVLADRMSRKWVPNLSGFFSNGLDFESANATFNYTNVLGDTVSPLDLAGYSFYINSKGRGRNMFKFNRKDEPFYVSTNAEVYILDKEYITVNEAKKWDKRNFDADAIGIYEPLDAPALSLSTRQLVDRVNNLDQNSVRLNFGSDKLLTYNDNRGKNFKIGNRALLLLKQATGITAYKSRKNLKDNWKEFRKDQVHKNNSRPLSD